MNKTKKILILGAGEMQVPIIEKSKQLNLFTIVIDYNDQAPGFHLGDLAYKISTIDDIGVLDIAKKHSIDGIVTTSDYPVRVLAYVCDQLGLKGITIDVAEIVTNKFLLRKKLHENGVLTQFYREVSCKNDLEDISEFPVIIKPVDSSASRGVKKVYNRLELLNQYETTKSFSISKVILVEEFLEGNEYSIESLTQNGVTRIVAITEKRTVGKEQGYFVEDRHIIPANISQTLTDEIEKLVVKCIEIIGLDNSAAHTEIIVTAKGIFVIEIGARLGGDNITSDLVPLATDTDMLESIIKISLGQRISSKRKSEKFAGIQFLTPDNYYECKKYIEISDDYSRVKMDKYKNVSITNSLDRLGYIIFQEDSREKLIEKLNFKIC